MEKYSVNNYICRVFLFGAIGGYKQKSTKLQFRIQLHNKQ